MARGLVYPRGLTDGKRALAAEDTTPAPAIDADGYKDKLVKYVPAEVIAFFVPITAFVGTGSDAALIAVFAIAIVATFLVLLRANLAVPVGQRAPWWSYVLAEAAFIAWALGTSPATASVINLSA